MTTTTARLRRYAFRLSADDVANLDAVADRLNAAGSRYVTRTDALREALRIAAESMQTITDDGSAQ